MGSGEAGRRFDGLELVTNLGLSLVVGVGLGRGAVGAGSVERARPYATCCYTGATVARLLQAGRNIPAGFTLNSDALGGLAAAS